MAADHIHNQERDMVDTFAERGLSYPVQSSDSTDVKHIQHSTSQNETTGYLDSGFSRYGHSSFQHILYKLQQVEIEVHIL